MNYLEILATIYVAMGFLHLLNNIILNVMHFNRKQDNEFHHTERKNLISHIDDRQRQIEVLKRENLKLTETLLAKNTEIIQSKLANKEPKP